MRASGLTDRLRQHNSDGQGIGCIKRQKRATRQGRKGGASKISTKRAREESQMSVIGWIILGLIAGFIASKIVNRSGEGLILDIILGIVGAVVGGWLFSFFGAEGVSGLNLYSMVVAIIGAIVVLFIYHAITGQRATR
jgi:uncharacterized membrane protein YeaQ/YmgE (transglycosylase-associated protein family)